MGMRVHIAVMPSALSGATPWSCDYSSDGEQYVNKIYSKVWSKSLNALVVASEFARANGKARASRRLRASLGALGLAAGILGSAHAATADQPAGAQTVAAPAPIDVTPSETANPADRKSVV